MRTIVSHCVSFISKAALVTISVMGSYDMNVFERLMEAVKYNSLGQISHALYDVGRECRRNV